MTRVNVIKNKGIDCFEKQFLPKFDSATTVGVLTEVPLMLLLVKIANSTSLLYSLQKLLLRMQEESLLCYN